jgi:hypothetical protein
MRTPCGAPSIAARTRRRRRVDTHNFTLIVANADLQSPEAQDALYDAGCDDATFGVVDGVQYAEFDREAGSFGQALTSAMVALRDAVPDARVVHVEPDELVTVSEIADRLGRTRESIRLLVSGDRGPGDFPPAVSHVRMRNRLWRWPEVLRWFATRYEDEFGDVLARIPEDPRITAMVNGYISYWRYRDSLSEDERNELEKAVGSP